MDFPRALWWTPLKFPASGPSSTARYCRHRQFYLGWPERAHSTAHFKTPSAEIALLLQAALLYGAQQDALPVLSQFAHMWPQETLTYPNPDKLWPIPVRHNAPALSPQSESVPLSDPSPQTTCPPSSVRQELVLRCVSKKQETHLTTLWVVPLGLEGSCPRKVGTQQWQSPIVISSQNPHTDLLSSSPSGEVALQAISKFCTWWE